MRHRFTRTLLLVAGFLVVAGLSSASFASPAGDPEERPVREKREKPAPREPRKGNDSRDPREGSDPRSTDPTPRGGDDRGRNDDPTTGNGDKTNAGSGRPDAPSQPRTPITTPGIRPIDPPGIAPLPVWEQGEIELHCDETWVCLVDPLDAYLAWMLVRETSIPWRHFVAARADDRRWSEVLRDLEVDVRETYAALGEDDPPARTEYALNDDVLRDLARAHLAGIDLYAFSCKFPVTIPQEEPHQMIRERRTRGRRPDIPTTDWVDDEVAERIREETGWCRDSLLEARRNLGSWSRVARSLYVSPFLFEASFGIELETRWVGSKRRAQYPREEVIRAVVLEDRWPETLRR